MTAPLVRVHARSYSHLPRVFRWFSDHCVLRQLDLSDVGRIRRAAAAADYACGWMATPLDSDAAVQAHIVAAQADWSRGTRYAMAVLRKQTHEFVAAMELTALPGRGAWQLGGYVDPAFLATPIAREALRAPLELLQTTLEATHVTATCGPERTALHAALRAAGFTTVGASARDRDAGGVAPLQFSLDLMRETERLRGSPFEDLLARLPPAVAPRPALSLL